MIERKDANNQQPNTLVKPVRKIRNLRLDTLMRYLVTFVKHDTWGDIENIRGVSTSTGMEVIRFGVEHGFLRRDPELKGNRVIYRIKLIEGTYRIKLPRGDEYTLVIKAIGDKKIKIEISKEIEL